MTFLHKLAKRLSIAGPWAVVLLAAGCSDPEQRDFLSPTPGTPSIQPISLAISPRTGSVLPGQTIRFSATARTMQGTTVPADVEWTASGGSIGADGVFTSSRNGQFRVSARARVHPQLTDSATVAVFTSAKDVLLVRVYPDSSVITEGEGVQLEAEAVLADGSVTRQPPVDWKANGGQVDGSGWFTAAAAGDYSVSASAAGGADGGTTVKVRPNRKSVQALSISPDQTGLSYGQSKKFDAIVTYTDGSQGKVSVSWSATGGSIGGDGTYTAGNTTGNYRVIGREKSVGVSDTAFVAIAEPQMTGLSVGPGVASLAPGATQQFTATATLVDGTTRTVGVTWSATGGTIQSGGLYTAGPTAGSYRVIGTATGTTFADTAEVTVAGSGVSLTQLILNPSSATVPVGTSRQFSVTGLYSDGSTSTPLVTWSATGGSVTAGGLYTAGTVQGTFRIIAREASGKADTSAITVAPPALTQLVLNPSAATLKPGETRTFSVSGLWSDGSTATPVVTYTAQGGAISAAGVYSAGSVGGTYPVIATHSGGTLADTSLVTIEIPPPTLTTLDLAPTSATTSPGGTVRFTVSGTWSDGSSATPPVTWSATGGQIGADGIYTAGSATGTYRVVATHSGSAKADTSAVTISSAAPVLKTLTLTPSSTSLQPGGTRQFYVSATWSDGSTAVPVVTWSATGGTITNGGLYAAGTTAGTYRVIATQQGGTLADTSEVAISQPATLVGVVITPDSGVVQTGQTFQFSASGVYSNGSTGAATVTWSATGGSISWTGLYTGGLLAGNFRVTATSGSLADTVGVRVASSAVLSSFTLTPASVTLAPGATQQFSTTATWSDGQVRPHSVTYTATGGSISSSGNYTAGQLSGAFMVVASCTCGSVDTSTVGIVSAVAPTLTAVVVSPASATVSAGGTFQFTASGTLSDGGTTSPAVTWTATSGSISGSGLYTAPGIAGTYTVRASHSGSGLSGQATVTVTASGQWQAALPELPRVFVNTRYVPPAGSVINVSAGGNLQSAINSAACGDEIRLAAGATYSGNFVLPARQCAANPIHIRSAGTLPPEGVRVNPTTAAGFAKLVSPNVDAALKGAPGARGYRVIALEFAVSSSATLNYGLVRVGETDEPSVDLLPGYITLDRVYVHGHPTLNLQRCVAFNGVHAAVVDSYLAECHARGFDSQAIGGWTGPGPFKIVNNYLEGAGENVMFGGASSRFPGVSPSDIEIRRNYITKPLTWLSSGAWTVKNLFELKNARRVLFEGNVLRNNWANGQVGYAVLFQSLNDGAGTSTTSAVVEDVTFRLNRVSASANGINMLAEARYQGDGPVLPISRVLIENNLFEEIGRADLLGDNAGILLQALGGSQGLRDITWNHNTMLHAGPGHAALMLDGAMSSRMVAVNNLFTGGSYGLFGNSVGEGNRALQTYWSDWAVSRNAFVARPPSPYPSGNFFPASVTSLGMDANARLGSGSGLSGQATDGTDVGADIGALLQAISGVVP